MVRSLLDIYRQSGFLPMWSTLAETNIMIATHADSLLAEAVVKGVRGFDLDEAWQAVYKDGTVPPEREDELRYEDREEYTPLEVRAGLSFYNHSGYVPLDGWSESTSRTLDYAYDDHAIAVLAEMLDKESDASFFHNRSRNYRHVFDHDQGLMAARLKNGTFLVQPLPDPRGRQEGFTEGNSFDYSFDVVQDVPGLAELVGGRAKLTALLDRHFSEGHNDQSNEPSHHILTSTRCSARRIRRSGSCAISRTKRLAISRMGMRATKTAVSRARGTSGAPWAFTPSIPCRESTSCPRRSSSTWRSTFRPVHQVQRMALSCASTRRVRRRPRLRSQPHRQRPRDRKAQTQVGRYPRWRRVDVRPAKLAAGMGQ